MLVGAACTLASGHPPDGGYPPTCWLNCEGCAYCYLAVKAQGWRLLGSVTCAGLLVLELQLTCIHTVFRYLKRYRTDVPDQVLLYIGGLCPFS